MGQGPGPCCICIGAPIGWNRTSHSLQSSLFAFKSILNAFRSTWCNARRGGGGGATWTLGGGAVCVGCGWLIFVMLWVGTGAAVAVVARLVVGTAITDTFVMPVLVDGVSLLPMSMCCTLTNTDGVGYCCWYAVWCGWMFLIPGDALTGALTIENVNWFAWPIIVYHWLDLNVITFFCCYFYSFFCFLLACLPANINQLAITRNTIKLVFSPRRRIISSLFFSFFSSQNDK